MDKSKLSILIPWMNDRPMTRVEFVASMVVGIVLDIIMVVAAYVLLPAMGIRHALFWTIALAVFLAVAETITITRANLPRYRQYVNGDRGPNAT